MAQVWRCDRCKKVSDGCVDDGPDGWMRYDMPVRGSEGARSVMVYHLCDECEDSLYAWLHRQDDSLATVVKTAANLLFNLGQEERPLDGAERKVMMTLSEELDPVTRALGGNPNTVAWPRWRRNQP